MRMEDDSRSACGVMDTWRQTVSESRKDNLANTPAEREHELRWKLWAEAKQVAKVRVSWEKCTAALLSTRPEEDR